MNESQSAKTRLKIESKSFCNSKILVNLMGQA